MAKSLYGFGRSEGITPRIIVTPVQAGIIAAIVLLLCVDWAVGAYRAKVAVRTDAAISASGSCPQSAETFDSQRAACLRRRWSAMRSMKPWPNDSQNAQLENCLRLTQGDVVVPFKPNTCSGQKTVSRSQD